MKKVLVTGGAGYIGSHACKALAQAGYTPVCYDSLEFGHDWAVKWGPLEKGLIEDFEHLVKVCRRHRPVAVLHFAAYAYVGESVVDPARYYHNNVAGSLSLLAAMRNTGIQHLVFSSSCATYGLPLAPLITESHPQNPINPYGHSKLMIEQIIKDYARAYGLSYALLRYFNAAGADPEQELGEDHEPETHLIPLAIRAAFEGKPLSVFGTDYNTPDGTAIRDYIHVKDLADAHVAALALLEANNGNLALNLGTGHGHSVHDIIAGVEKVTEKRVQRVNAPRRDGDPPQLVADATLAGDILNWRPRFSSIQEIIATAFCWHNHHSFASGPIK